MAHEGNIIIPNTDPREAIAIKAAEQNKIPLRIKCPDCGRTYVLFIESFDQGLYCLLGQSCRYCGRFIKETDDPKELLLDAKEMRELIEGEEKKGGKA